MGWDRYIGSEGNWRDGFGASAPTGVLYDHFGINAGNVVAQGRLRFPANILSQQYCLATVASKRWTLQNDDIELSDSKSI